LVLWAAIKKKHPKPWKSKLQHAILKTLQLHLQLIKNLGFEESVIENGVYNVNGLDFDSEINFSYSVSEEASNTQAGVSLVIGDSGTITVTDTKVVFDVIGKNFITGSTVTIVGEGNF